jgi:hypothetical protein
MPKTRHSFAGIVIATLGVFAGCNTGPNGPLTVPLEFRPSDAEAISTPIAAVDVKVFIAPLKDKRENKEQIGENVEEQTPVPVLSGDKSPTDFVYDVLTDELKDSGLELTDAAEAADRVIELDLTKFWVREESSYRAEVQVIAVVRDKGGSVKFKERIAGEGSTGGRSLNPENYQESLSDATRRVVGGLLNNAKFQAALTR